MEPLPAAQSNEVQLWIPRRFTLGLVFKVTCGSIASDKVVSEESFGS